MSEHIPDLSVVVVSPEGGAGIARLMRRLRTQSIAAQLEILICVSIEATETVPPDWEAAFHSVRFIPADLTSSARARVPAIHAARAPCVALAEDHCFPVDDTWAERLLDGLRQGHAAVGPRIRNANPGTATSWALLMAEYSPWIAGGAARQMDLLPGHNSAYDRAVLLSFGNTLPALLEAEFLLHRALRAQGRTLLHDPRIEVEHLNHSLPLAALKLSFMSGWMFAASRSKHWTGAHRAVYAVAGPLIGVRRFPRVMRQSLGDPVQRGDILRALPMMAAILMASGLGEGIGYAFGDGGRRAALSRMEYHRWRNMRPEEQTLAR
ncbi:hypothetical protein N9W17_02435 [Jannaschia sp.]|nr:hypothetical protein [Jannaschia sp.]